MHKVKMASRIDLIDCGGSIGSTPSYIYKRGLDPLQVGY
jgi:hypothetical protein